MDGEEVLTETCHAQKKVERKRGTHGKGTFGANLRPSTK